MCTPRSNGHAGLITTGGQHVTSNRGAAAAQALRGHRGGRRHLLRGPAGRDLRDPRPQRRGQDHDRGVPRGTAKPRPGHGQRSRAQPTPAKSRADPAARRAAPGQPAAGQAAGRRGARPVQLLLPQPGRLAVPHRPARANQQDENQVRQAVRRPEAAPVDRAGAGRHPADRHHGRTHHRPGPGRPPRHLGAHRKRQGPRRHHRPGHPLHGRGRTPLRPRGPDRLGPRRGHRHPGQPGRRGRDRAAHPVPPVRAAPGQPAGEPAGCHPRHPQGRCRGRHRQQQRAQRGHLRAGPQPDRGPAAARGPGQPGGRVPRPHRTRKSKSTRHDRHHRSATKTSENRAQLRTAQAHRDRAEAAQPRTGPGRAPGRDPAAAADRPGQRPLVPPAAGDLRRREPHRPVYDDRDRDGPGPARADQHADDAGRLPRAGRPASGCRPRRSARSGS